MKIVIDIPKEFEKDYTRDSFKEFFGRVMADMNCLCGNYEKEIAEMFIRTFAESKELQNHIAIWEEMKNGLPKKPGLYLVRSSNNNHTKFSDYKMVGFCGGTKWLDHLYTDWMELPKSQMEIQYDNRPQCCIDHHMNYSTCDNCKIGESEE